MQKYKRFFKYKGFKCTILETPEFLNLCGYVHMPANEYNFIDSETIIAHGSINYDRTKDNTRIIGFDCAHCGDIIPGIEITSLIPGNTYKDIDYVTKELKSIVNQIIKFREIEKEKFYFPERSVDDGKAGESE